MRSVAHTLARSLLYSSTFVDVYPSVIVHYSLDEHILILVVIVMAVLLGVLGVLLLWHELSLCVFVGRECVLVG